MNLDPTQEMKFSKCRSTQIEKFLKFNILLQFELWKYNHG